MLVAEIRRERYETVHVVRRSPRGDFLEARSPDGVPAFLFVPSDMKLYEAECARMRMFRSPGVPEIREVFAGAAGTEAICMDGIPAARPLDSADVAPASVLRTGLVTLLSTLSHAHAHDFAHGRIAPDSVFIDTSGSLLLLDWTSARRVSDEPLRRRGIHAVARDVRALGAALLAWVGRLDGRGRAEMAPDVAEHASAIVAGEDPELARVLVRMASADPMEAYEYAGEALLDLGARDLSLGDPWLDLPLIGRGRMIRRIADAVTSVRDGERSGYSAVVEGAGGTGRTSVLREIARRCRERGHSVVHIEGRDTSAPWEPIASLARQLATRLPSDSPYRNAPEVRALLDAQSPEAQRHLPSGGEQVARTAYELASPRNPEVTVVLLDDEDALPSHILGAWREFEQLAAPAGASAAGSRPRFALIAATMAPAAPGDRRERHTLECLDERQVHKLVEWLLTVPPRAPIIADPLWRVTAGRPSEIAAYMRRLDRDGVVRRMARRWALLADEVQLGAEYLEDGVRRTLAALSPDATRMAELLAVLGGAGARRSDVIDIADIPAHRLQPVAYECERAGLAARTGTGWRIFTPARAERVLAGIGDDRRRALEREVLERYLDRAPGDQDPALLAHHARACSDPRAASFCRAAALAHVEALRYEQAARLLDETIDAIDPAMADADLQVAYIEALVRRDRRTDVVARAEAVLNDPRLPDPVRDRIVLAAYRLSEGVLAPGFLPRLPVSDALRDPATRSEIRLWRARALALAGRDTECEREMRLADGELGGATPSRWNSAVSELCLAVIEFSRLSFAASYRHETRALRTLRHVAPMALIVHAIYRCHRVAIQLDAESRALKRLRRLRRRYRDEIHADRRLRSHIRDLEVYLEHWMGHHSRCSTRHEAACTGSAMRDDPGHYLLSMSGMIQSRIEHGTASRNDRHRTRDMLWLLSTPLGRDINFRFARCALYFGFHAALVDAAVHASFRRHTPYDQGMILLAACRAQMLADRPVGVVLALDDTAAELVVRTSLQGAFGAEMLNALRSGVAAEVGRESVAPSVLARELRNSPEGSSGLTEMLEAFEWNPGAPGAFEDVDLVLTLLVEPVPDGAQCLAIDPELLEAVLGKRAPLVVEWRRLLWLAIVARNQHRMRDAEAIAHEARTAIWGIRDADLGLSAKPLRDHAFGVMATHGFPEPPAWTELPGASLSRVAGTTTMPTAEPEMAPATPWAIECSALRQGTERILIAGGGAEMEALHACLRAERSVLVVSAVPDPRRITPGALVVCGGLDLWTPDDVRGLLRYAATGVAANVACTLLETVATARRTSSVHRAVLDLLGGRGLGLSAPLDRREVRSEFAAWYWERVMGKGRRLAAGVRRVVAGHSWPGGVGELRAALESVAAARTESSAVEALVSWLERDSTDAGGSAGSRVAMRMEMLIRRCGPMGIRELHERLAVPRRTAQRAVRDLVKLGALRSIGRARGTVYAPA